MVSMEERVARLELWREQAELRFERLNNELRDNTLMTAAVKKDTDEIVTLLKMSKLNLRIIKGLAAFGAFLATIWGALHYGR